MAIGKRLSQPRINLYRRLLKRSYTLPGMLPFGDGLAHGLWEDVILFDPQTFRAIATVVLQTITHPICDRATTIEYNLGQAGLAEGAVYPKEFTPQMMAIKQKHRKQWKHDWLKSFRVKKNRYQVMHSSENPIRLCKPMDVERLIYKTGLTVRPSRYRGENPILFFTLNEEKLTVPVVKKYGDEIFRLTARYAGCTGLQRPLFVPLSTKGSFLPHSQSFLKPYEFTLSDQQCLDIHQRLQKQKTNLMSNQFFMPVHKKPRRRKSLVGIMNGFNVSETEIDDTIKTLDRAVDKIADKL